LESDNTPSCPTNSFRGVGAAGGAGFKLGAAGPIDDSRAANKRTPGRPAVLGRGRTDVPNTRKDVPNTHRDSIVNTQ
jgi:hypothetical protein